jgi:hypothetical protein
MEQLRSCRSKSVAQYAESIRIAVKSDNQEQYTSILNERANGWRYRRSGFARLLDNYGTKLGKPRQFFGAH